MSSVKITEFLNLHGEYVGVVIGTADGWTLPSTRLSSLSSLAKQIFPSREGLLVAIDDCLGPEVVAQMEQQRLQDEAEIRGRGGCLAIRTNGRRCQAKGEYFDEELNGLNCGMHPEPPPRTIEEAQEWESAWQADGEATQAAEMERQEQAHERARTALAEACTDRMLTQMVKEVTRLSQKRRLSPQVRKFLEQVITEDNYLMPGRAKHMHVLL
jgi:uncharacterized protein YfaQ (DUF2300 family)